MNFRPLLIAALLLGMPPAAMAATSMQTEAAPDHSPWTVEATLLYLRARDNETSNYGYNNQNHEPGYRLTLGYQPEPSALGYRVVYTNWEGTHLSYGQENGPELDIVDFEVFKSFEHSWCEGSYSLGVRHMHIYEPYTNSADVDFGGTGPVIGAELVKPIASALSIYLEAESAWIMGRDKAQEISNRILAAQLGAGLLYDLELFDADGYVKLGYEWQYYHSATYGSADATIEGLALAVGFSF